MTGPERRGEVLFRAVSAFDGSDAAEASAAAGDYLRDMGAETVECCYPDLLGALVGRTMTVSRFLETLDGGFGMPTATLAWNIVGDIEPLEFVSAATGFPNMRAFPDLSTLRPSAWRPDTAMCLCDTRIVPKIGSTIGTPSMDGPTPLAGDPTALDSRELVRSAAGRLAELGVSITIASEVEFYLTTESREPLTGDHKCFSLEIAGEVEPTLADIRSTLVSSGIDVESSQTEYGPGQFEINTYPGSPLDVADSAAILKYLVKRVARRHGLRATFMAKPFDTGSASGLHVHQAVASTADRSGARCFGLSTTTARYLAGLLAFQPEVTAMCMPTVTAYKRMGDYSMAANRAVWGVDNRTTLVRVIHDTTARVESRIGSADANPYHVIASCLAAGVVGVRDRMNPPPPATGDAYQLADAPRLPGTLTEAAARLGSSEFARKSFGDVFVDVLATVCQREADLFHASVTDWERRRYFDLA